ncbi:MAG: SDR family NAD(P)-dependent oxidoreductase, partial [Actinobacteria bacterium]
MLQDQVAVVAGAGRGIGRMTALTLAAAGAAVAVVDVETDRADNVAREIEAAGQRAAAVVAELRDPDDADRVISTATSQLGGLDVLVNVAGGMNVYAPWRPLARWTEDSWDEIQDRNLRYVFLTCRAAIRTMLEQDRGGSIVNITSISGIASAPNHAAYGAAKAGLVNLTKSLAVEYGPQGIRVNAVAPGSVETPAVSNRELSGDAARGPSPIPL